MLNDVIVEAEKVLSTVRSNEYGDWVDDNKALNALYARKWQHPNTQWFYVDRVCRNIAKADIPCRMSWSLRQTDK